MRAKTILTMLFLVSIGVAAFVILHALPPAWRRGFDVAADLTMIAVCVILIVLGWPAVSMLAEFDQRSQAAEIPLVIPQALVPIGLGLNAFLVAARLLLRRAPAHS